MWNHKTETVKGQKKLQSTQYVQMSGWLRSHFRAASVLLGFTVRLVLKGRERLVVAETSKRAKQTQRRTASGVWCSRRLVPWLRDYKQGMTGDGTKVHSPGTHYTPHQGAMRETHVANRRLWKQGKKGKGGGETLEEELCEWVGEWLKRVLCYKKAC